MEFALFGFDNVDGDAHEEQCNCAAHDGYVARFYGTAEWNGGGEGGVEVKEAAHKTYMNEQLTHAATHTL